MNSDSLKKYSDKLFFSILAKKELDDEDLLEITEHHLNAQEEKKEKSETWRVAHEHKDKMKLQPGEFPALFKEKVLEELGDIGSENSFYVTDGGVTNALFIPTPASLLLGDLLRANPKMLPTSQMPLKDVLSGKSQSDIKENLDQELESLDFSGFKEPEQTPEPKSNVAQDLKAAGDLLKDTIKSAAKDVTKDLKVRIGNWLTKKFKL